MIKIFGDKENLFIDLGDEIAIIKNPIIESCEMGREYKGLMHRPIGEWEVLSPFSSTESRLNLSILIPDEVEVIPKEKFYGECLDSEIENLIKELNRKIIQRSKKNG